MSPRKSEGKPARELSPEQAAAAAMIAEAEARGLALTGPDSLLKVFTKNVLETALNEEMTEHLTGSQRARFRTRLSVLCLTDVPPCPTPGRAALARSSEGCAFTLPSAATRYDDRHD